MVSDIAAWVHFLGSRPDSFHFCLPSQQWLNFKKKKILLSISRMLDIGITFLGPVVQSIISLTSLLRGQLVKCFATFITTLIFFVENMREAFAFLRLFKKILAYFRY